MFSRAFHMFPAVQMWQKSNAAVFTYCKSRFMPQMCCRERARKGKPTFPFFIAGKHYEVNHIKKANIHVDRNFLW